MGNTKTQVLGTVNGKTFYLKIDTGSAVTGMNINPFETAFSKKKGRAKPIQNLHFYINDQFLLNMFLFR